MNVSKHKDDKHFKEAALQIKRNKNRNYHTVITFSRPHRETSQVDIPTIHDSLLDRSRLN